MWVYLGSCPPVLDLTSVEALQLWALHTGKHTCAAEAHWVDGTIVMEVRPVGDDLEHGPRPNSNIMLLSPSYNRNNQRVKHSTVVLFIGISITQISFSKSFNNVKLQHLQKPSEAQLAWLPWPTAKSIRCGSGPCDTDLSQTVHRQPSQHNGEDWAPAGVQGDGLDQPADPSFHNSLLLRHLFQD